jgi:hypothetical protein
MFHVHVRRHLEAVHANQPVAVIAVDCHGVHVVQVAIRHPTKQKDGLILVMGCIPVTAALSLIMYLGHDRVSPGYLALTLKLVLTRAYRATQSWQRLVVLMQDALMAEGVRARQD